MFLLSRDQPEIVIMISGYTPCAVTLSGIFFLKTIQKDGYEIQDLDITVSLVSDGVHGGNAEQDVQGSGQSVGQGPPRILYRRQGIDREDLDGA